MNYQKQLDELLENKDLLGKKVLVHSCCAPCSSYVIESLRQYFALTIFYYNPNISDISEYDKRAAEQKRLIREMDIRNYVCQDAHNYPVDFMEGLYEPERFFEIAEGLENCAEGGERCLKCYELRLRKTAMIAKKLNYDYYVTTLSISPLKSSEKLNEIGRKVGEEIGIPFLPSDFKKKEGYKRSIELSAEYELYRQNYCGCVYSKDATKKNLQESTKDK